jgi:hypothetical protein
VAKLRAMLVTEAEWIAGALAGIPDAELFPLLNVGSSTADFRARVQPHIDEKVFAPLSKRGGRVWHADLKPAVGVDIVGDLAATDTADQLRQLAIRSALVSNVLEHVLEPDKFARAIIDLVPAGGYILVSGPQRFPHHPDPIDNGLRPEPEEVLDLFPGTRLKGSTSIDGGNWRQWDARERPRSRSRLLVRSLIPFYGTDEWRDAARNVPYLLRHIRAFGVVLQKR